jgi:hypothetical protein
VGEAAVTTGEELIWGDEAVANEAERLLLGGDAVPPALPTMLAPLARKGLRRGLRANLERIPRFGGALSSWLLRIFFAKAVGKSCKVLAKAMEQPKRRSVAGTRFRWRTIMDSLQ